VPSLSLLVPASACEEPLGTPASRPTAGAVSRYARKSEQIAAEAALDGLYVLRTTCAQDELGALAVVRAYKQLKVAERAFRTMKSTLDIRPIRHHLEDRVRAHVFLCLLAYYVSFELAARLTPLLFTDESPIAPIDPVAPAIRSGAAKAKAGSHTNARGLPASSLPDLLAELGTLCRNELRVGKAEHTFKRLTSPTQLQAGPSSCSTQSSPRRQNPPAPQTTNPRGQ